MLKEKYERIDSYNNVARTRNGGLKNVGFLGLMTRNEAAEKIWIAQMYMIYGVICLPHWQAMDQLSKAKLSPEKIQEIRYRVEELQLMLNEIDDDDITT